MIHRIGQKMGIKKIAFLLSFISFAGNVSAVEGFVVTKSNGNVFLYTTDKNSVGKNVVFQYSDGKRGRCCESAIVGEMVEIEDHESLSDVLMMEEVYKFSLGDVLPREYWHPFVGAAFVGAKEAVRMSAAGFDVTEGGKQFSLRTCTSSEGVHLVRTLKGKTYGHLYMGFDYDVKPTCSGRELK